MWNKFLSCRLKFFRLLVSKRNFIEHLELLILSIACGKLWYFFFLGWTFVSRDFMLNNYFVSQKMFGS